MLHLLSIVSPIFIVLALGKILSLFNLIKTDFINASNRLIFFVLLPALLFYKIAQAEIYTSFNLTIFLVMCVTVFSIFMLSFIVGRIFHVGKKQLGTFAMNNFRANYAYMGLPVSYYAFGDEGLMIASLLMAFIVPLVNLLSIISLSLNSSKKVRMWTFIKNTLLNPLAIGCILGIIFSLAKIEFYYFIDKTLSLLTGVTLPLALLCIGATMKREMIRGNKLLIANTLLIKLLVMPFTAFLIISTFSETISLTGQVLIIMLSSPAATVNYVLASSMDGDPDVASGGIILSTVFSLFTYIFWLAVLV
ncbi:AEC family transporter [Flexistipes sinusarabici]|uniref:AEC family transporter n=1 Tax=Flexistipes sinusarabici TaxID=2352 RepID=UPI002357014D|nr:AEC family transporter [Flexistipes sinusarabici]